MSKRNWVAAIVVAIIGGMIGYSIMALITGFIK